MSESERPDAESGQDTAAAALVGGQAAAALAAFETFRDEVNQLLCEVRAGETARAKRLAPVASELARAVSRMADEAAKLQTQTEAQGAGNGDMSLDLAAARAEIRRRLARLRDAAARG